MIGADETPACLQEMLWVGLHTRRLKQIQTLSGCVVRQVGGCVTLMYHGSASLQDPVRC